MILNRTLGFVFVGLLHVIQDIVATVEAYYQVSSRVSFCSLQFTSVHGERTLYLISTLCSHNAQRLAESQKYLQLPGRSEQLDCACTGGCLELTVSRHLTSSGRNGTEIRGMDLRRCETQDPSNVPEIDTENQVLAGLHAKPCTMHS